MTALDLYADGASRFNPGPSGVGVVIYKNEEEFHTISQYIGEATNNEAEYIALIKGLEYLAKINELSVNCYLDSKLVVEQAKGNYRVRAENLIKLNTELKLLIKIFQNIEFNHIPRVENSRADELANKGIDTFKGKE